MPPPERKRISTSWDTLRGLLETSAQTDLKEWSHFGSRKLADLNSQYKGMPRGNSDKYAIHLSESDLDELDKLAQATKGQNSEVKKAGYTAMLNDVLQRSDTAIVMQEQSQAYMQRTAKWLFVIIVAMSILLLAHFALTFSAIELSKESHVKLGTLTDTAGKVVQVASSDFHLGPGGKMVQRTSGRRLAEGDQPGGAIGTAPVLSKYKLSSRIPNKYLEELESITMARPCAKDATVAECDSKPTAKAIVKSFKRKPREGSHCGSVVVFQTDMGELTLDDETLYHDGAEMAADGVFSTDENAVGTPFAEYMSPGNPASAPNYYNWLVYLKSEESTPLVPGPVDMGEDGLSWDVVAFAEEHKLGTPVGHAYSLYGARFWTEIYTRGCHWFPHLLA
jgi:hypothetical protein